MKVLVCLLCFVSFSAIANTKKIIREISRAQVHIPVVISAETVRCSAVGYSMPELKIDVPALDFAATFQHRNFGEGQPCMTAGLCRKVGGPEVILAGGEETIETLLTVVHQEVAWVDDVHNTCHRQIEEVLEMDVRGHTFKHVRQAPLVQVDAKLCRQILQ
jgi:hypothetical protein